MDGGQFILNKTVLRTTSDDVNQYNDTISYICLTSAIISVLVNTLLVIFLVKSKLVQRSIYFVISHISGLLVLLSLLDIAHYFQYIFEDLLALDVLENVRSHILLCLNFLVFVFSFKSFIEDEALCKHRVRIIFIVGSALICYSVSVMLFGDVLFYPVFAFRLIMAVVIFITLIYKMFVYFYNRCTMSSIDVLLFALTLNFFWCWLPDLITSIYDDEPNTNIKCINSIISYCNGWLNLVWLYILDGDFKSYFAKIFDEGSNKYVSVDIEKSEVKNNVKSSLLNKF